MALEYREAIRELSTPDKISYPLPIVVLPFSLPTLDDVSKRCLRTACSFQRDFSFERTEDPPGVIYWLNSREYGSLGGLRLSLLENQTAVTPIPVSHPTGQEMSSLQIPYHLQKTLFEAKKTASAQLFRMYLIFLRDDIIWGIYPDQKTKKPPGRKKKELYIKAVELERNNPNFDTWGWFLAEVVKPGCVHLPKIDKERLINTLSKVSREDWTFEEKDVFDRLHKAFEKGLSRNKAKTN